MQCRWLGLEAEYWKAVEGRKWETARDCWEVRAEKSRVLDVNVQSRLASLVANT